MSISAKVVCGFPAEVTEANKEVTRYDPKTGKPFQVEEFSHYQLFVGDKLIIDSVDDPSYVLDFPAKFNSGLFEGLEGYSAGYRGGNHFLGVRLAETRQRGSVCETFDISAGVPEVVARFAMTHGIEPAWYLLLSGG